MIKRQKSKVYVYHDETKDYEGKLQGHVLFFVPFETEIIEEFDWFEKVEQKSHKIPS